MKHKKTIALGMAGTMAAAVLAGCGASGSNGTSSSASGSTGDSGAATEIIWKIRGDEPKNYESVMAAVNEKLKQDINMTLDLQFIAPGDYDTKMQMAMAGGDAWDLCFTSHWANNYVTAAGKGAFLQLDDLLKENAPDVLATIPEKFWEGIRINGGIYALMNYQAMYDQAGYMFLKSAAEEQNIDVSSINSWDSLNGALEQLAAAYPDKYATRGGGVASVEQLMQETPISTVMNLPFLAYDPESKQLSNDMFFTKAEDALKSFKLWKDKNYTPADAATLKDEATLLSQGAILSRYQRMKPGLETALQNLYKNEWQVVPMSQPIINTTAAQSTLTAVNVNSKHPEKAIQLYNYVFSNKEVSNMLFFGLEGQDYEIVKENHIKKLPDSWNASAWMLGNQFNAYLMETDPDGIWEETMQGNESAALDPLFGFVPDRTPIETEVATCEAIWLEYKDILYYGLQDYKTAIPEMMNKLNKAGLEKVTAEMQKQVDAFLAAKG